MYLLDTNVVSEMRKALIPEHRGVRIDPNLKSWIETVPSSLLFLSVIVILELETGFLLLERHDPFQAAILRSWVRDNVIPEFNGRILPVDLPVTQRCAMLQVPNPVSYGDSLIAATALVHGLTVVTRNVRDFESTGVRILNPWQN